MLVYVLKCKPKIMKCKFFFVFFLQTYLKIAAHFAKNKRENKKLVLLGRTYLWG